MGEELTSEERQSLEQARSAQSRQLRILLVLTLLGSAVTLIFVSVAFALGVLLGGAVSFANFYWMKFTLRSFFENAPDGPTSATSLSLRFIGRYFALGAIVLIVFLTGVLPVIAVLLGISGFALAVMFDGFASIFKPVNN